MVVFFVWQRNGSLEEETEVETDVIINFRIACYLHINIELVFFFFNESGFIVPGLLGDRSCGLQLPGGGQLALQRRHLRRRCVCLT